MPSQFGWRKHYNVDDEDDDDGDKVVPIHCEEAFRNGLTFKAKFIGSMVVPRPTRRMEIVVAMRQVRYNTKAKQTAKVKCLATISVKGVRSIRRPSKKQKKNMKEEECIVGGHEIVMMNDPIYRIFYVSHDSHDLNVWSYIARDAASNTFRCNVFKCTRKSKAMKVVRTIGQAFEVCHKITQHQQHVLTGMDVYERIRSKKDHQLTPLEQHAIKIAEIHGWRIKPANLATSQSVAMETDIDAPPTTTAPVTMETDLDAVTTTTPGSERRREKPRISTDLDRVTRSVTSAAGSKTTSSSTRKVKRKSSSHASSAVKTTTTSNNKMNNSNNNSSNKSFSTQQHIKLLQQQAQLADQQAQIAANQVKQLRVQLKLEMNARSETQARNHRLLVQNRELIQQLSELVTFVKMSEAQQQQQQQQEEDVNTTANSTDVSGENSNNSDLPGMISLSNLQQMITESEARPCTTVIANDRLDSSSVSTDIDRMKQERRNGISGHSYFTSSSDDSSLQTLTNRLSESHPGSCSSDSSTSSDEDDHFINEMKSHHLGEIQCNGNISFENEEEYEGRKSDDKLDSFSDTSISALTEDDSSNQQQKPNTPLDETSVWTTGNSSSHFETSQQETDDDKKSTDNSFTLSPIPKSQFTDVTPLNFEESFVVSRLNTELDHGSFSDLRKLENDPIVADITTVATTTSNQESKNEPLEASAMEYMLSAAQQVETAQLSNGSTATSSYYFNSLETNFDDNSNYKQHSLQETNNNNSTNPFRTTTTTNNIFSEPAIFESELRYEPLRKVQAAERWRGSQVFTSLTSAITVDHSSANEEPSLNSFLDTVDTSSSSTTVSMTTTNVYRHQHNK